MSDLNAYRASARAFLESMDAKYGRDARVGNTVEQDLALGREYMAAKHDAGFAGINWPVDMGGQGLTHLHKIAFDGEEMQFGMPVGFFGISLGMPVPSGSGYKAGTMISLAPEYVSNHSSFWRTIFPWFPAKVKLMW